MRLSTHYSLLINRYFCLLLLIWLLLIQSEFTTFNNKDDFRAVFSRTVLGEPQRSGQSLVIIALMESLDDLGLVRRVDRSNYVVKQHDGIVGIGRIRAGS